MFDPIRYNMKLELLLASAYYTGDIFIGCIGICLIDLCNIIKK